MGDENVHVTPAGTQVARFVYKEPRNTADIATEQKLCFQLRIEHYTIREIAAMTGLSVGTVHKRISDEITETVAPYRERYRSYARERLDNMSRHVLELMGRPRYLMAKGKVVLVDGEPVVDAYFQLHCLDRLITIERQRAENEGYKAPDPAQSERDEPLPEDIEVAGLIRAAQERAAQQRATLRAEG